MPKYTFRCVEPVHLCKSVDIEQDGEFVARLPLFPNIWYRYTLTKLKEWLGNDNTSNIVNHGEVVTLERESPILSITTLKTPR